MTQPASPGRRASPKPLPPQLAAYLAAVMVVGGATVIVSVFQLPSTPRPLEWLLFAALGLFAGTYAVKVPGINALISVSDTFFLASGILFGPAPAMLAIGIDSALLSWRRGYSRSKLLFNATAPSLALWTAVHVFLLLAGSSPVTENASSIPALLIPLVVMTVVWFLLNSGLTAVAVALESGKPILQVWKCFAMLSVNSLAAASASFCMVIIMRYAGTVASAAVLPLVLIFHLMIRTWLGRLDDAQKHIETVDRLYLSTVETLATAIEAKDGVTADHIRRVQNYAVGLAGALGVRDELTIKAIEAAALLHDTGKLAVPEHILNKPGKLTAPEFEQMKLHVDVGADILSAIDFPYPVVPIVRCHHENWDGTGYPRGVSGTEIPIGARILSVVDCYDALTSDRPYRRALNDEAAIAILMERRGTMYDPLVVDAFVRVLPSIAARPSEAPQHEEALAHIRSASAPSARPAPESRTEDRAELHAFVSLARIVTADAAPGDVLLLASTHLRRIVPAATMATFLVSESDGERLELRHAAGALAGALDGLAIRVGHKLTGWVAANRRTIVNSDAALDLADLDLPPASRVCLSTPLLDGGKLVGVLSLYADPAETFTEEQGRLVEMVAPHLARMVAVARGVEIREPQAPQAPVVIRAGASEGSLRLVASR